MKAEKSTKSNCSYNSLSSAPISSMMSVLPLLLMACLLMCPQLPVDGTPPPVKSVFVLQPRPIYYIVRDSAVSVECEALHVAKLAIKCNGDFVQVSKYSLTHNQEKDTEKISINFTRADLVDINLLMGGGDGPDSSGGAESAMQQCVCVAWSKNNNWYEIESDQTTIRLAYLKRSFEREPLRLEVDLGKQAEFLCAPPDGQPPPSVYWRKQDKDQLEGEGEATPLSTETHPNYHISNNGRTLLIHQASYEDEGKYECVAENMAGDRVTMAAPLTIAVRGNWASWGAWSDCSSQCGRGTQSRHRECLITKASASSGSSVNRRESRSISSILIESTPPSLLQKPKKRKKNGKGDKDEEIEEADIVEGTFGSKEESSKMCEGEATQTADCTKMCPKNGGWGVWGDWSNCGASCTKYRRRFCINPPPSHGGLPCLGSGMDRSNCTGGECPVPYYNSAGTTRTLSPLQPGHGGVVRSDPGHLSLKEVLLYVGLVMIVAVFLAVALLVLFLIHRRNKFYAGVLSLDERHQHYPSVGLSSYSGTGTAGTGETGLTITKCGTIAAASKHHHLHGAMGNMIDMPYHISHGHLLRHHHHMTMPHPHSLVGGSCGSAGSNSGSHYSNNQHAHHHLSTATTTTSINHHSLLSTPSPTTQSATDPNHLGGTGRAVTPTYQYIEEHHPAWATTPTTPPSVYNVHGAPHQQLLAMGMESLYPHYAHISDPVSPNYPYYQQRPQLEGEREEGERRGSRRSRTKRNSAHSRFSVDSGHGAEGEGDHGQNLDEGEDGQSSDDTSTIVTGNHNSNNPTTNPNLTLPLYSSTCMLPPSIDPGSVAVGLVGYAGGRLSLPESGISLLIPEGAIPQGRTEELFLASSSDMEQNPRLLHKSDTILSATVFAGPPHTVLLKPAILSFDQSASRNSSDHWTTSLYTQTPNAHWKVCGESEKDTCVHIGKNSCYVLSEKLHFKYCLIGKASPSSSASKHSQLLLFGGYLSSTSNYSVRLYILNDNKDALARTMSDEMKMGGFLLNSPLKMLLHFDQGALRIGVSELCNEWNHCGEKEIIIPLERIWNDTSGNFHLSFEFRPSPSTSDLPVNESDGKTPTPPPSLWPLSATVGLCQQQQKQHQKQQTNSIPFCIKPHEIPVCPPGLMENSWLYSSQGGRVFRLPPFVRSRLAAALSESWTKLAKAIGLQRPVIDYLKRRSAPVESVLDMWECRTHNQDSLDLAAVLTQSPLHRADLLPLLQAAPVSPSPPTLSQHNNSSQSPYFSPTGGDGDSNCCSLSDANSCHLSSSC